MNRTWQSMPLLAESTAISRSHLSQDLLALSWEVKVAMAVKAQMAAAAKEVLVVLLGSLLAVSLRVVSRRISSSNSNPVNKLEHIVDHPVGASKEV